MKANELADTFILILQDWLSNNKIFKLREENQYLKETNICASHDYCDANQAMINALQTYGIELDLQDEKQIKLINDAWDTAKRNDFKTRIQQLKDLGFPMLADWIHEGEINSVQEALKHIEENKHMMDDAEDEKAFDQAEEIVEEFFNHKN